VPVTLDVLEKIQNSKQIKNTEITHIKYISAKQQKQTMQNKTMPV